MAMGVSSIIATQTGAIVSSDGTSYASPILAGAVASFWSAFPNKTNSEIVQLVRASADRFLNPNNGYGYGIPDFQLAYNSALSTSDFNKKGFTIYPNPAFNKINVNFSETVSNAQIVIYNNLGQVVLQNKLEMGQPISLEALNSGVYIYKITFDYQTETGKLIKK
jgi:subtilisin family serine protease